MLMLGIGLAYRHEVELVTGVTILAALVLLRTTIVRRRMSAAESAEAPDALETDPELPRGISGTG